MQYKDVFQTLRGDRGGCFEWSGKSTRNGNVLDQQQIRNLRLLFAEEDAQTTALTLKVVELFFGTAVI